MDQAEEREEVLKVTGAINAVNKEPEENEKRTRRIEFCFDSGTVKTSLRPKDLDKKNLVATKDTGRNFRAANGGFIPDLGAVELNGKSVNKSNMKVVAQVAEDTKPLATAVEMVQANNIVVLNKKGGTIKHMTDGQMAQLEDFWRNMQGFEIPISMKDNQFTVAMDVDVDVCEEEDDIPPPVPGGWKTLKRKLRACGARNFCRFGCECPPVAATPYFAPLVSRF